MCSARSSRVGRRIASRIPPGHYGGRSSEGNDNHMEISSFFGLLVFVALLVFESECWSFQIGATNTRRKTSCSGSLLFFLVFVAANPSDEACKKSKRCIGKKTFPNLPQIIPSHPQIFPKPSQNPPQTLPNRRKTKVAPRKRQKLKKNRLVSMSVKLLGAVFDAQSAPREAQEPPQSSQNGAPNAKKSMFKNKSISDSIFSWFGCDF